MHVFEAGITEADRASGAILYLSCPALSGPIFSKGRRHGRHP
jgi:hypothetical protein